MLIYNKLSICVNVKFFVKYTLGQTCTNLITSLSDDFKLNHARHILSHILSVMSQDKKCKTFN